jgi:hypothetical protein
VFHFLAIGISTDKSHRGIAGALAEEEAELETGLQGMAHADGARCWRPRDWEAICLTNNYESSTGAWRVQVRTLHG